MLLPKQQIKYSGDLLLPAASTLTKPPDLTKPGNVAYGTAPLLPN